MEIDFIEPTLPNQVEFRITKKEKSIGSKVTFEADVPIVEKDIVPNLNTSLGSDKLVSTFHKVNQSGYRTSKTFETSVVGQLESFPINTEKESKRGGGGGGGGVDSDILNKFKNTYRSGDQREAPDNITTDLKLNLMDTTMPYPVKNKGIYGYTTANGHNGLQKQNLFIATYVDAAGNNIGKN